MKEEALVLSIRPRFPVNLRVEDIETCALLLAALEDFALTCEADSAHDVAGTESVEGALAERLLRSAGLARRIIDSLEDAPPVEGTTP